MTFWQAKHNFLTAENDLFIMPKKPYQVNKSPEAQVFDCCCYPAKMSAYRLNSYGR